METFSRRQVLAAGAAAAAATAAGTVFGQTAPTKGDAMLKTGLEAAFANGQYVLPKLPYDYAALEPAYDARTVEIHYTKHHAGYVKGFNTTLEKLDAARKANDFAAVKALSRDLAFHGSGHVLHCLFWQSMKPGGSMGDDAFTKALERDFGSRDAALAQFAAATKAVEGSGWGVLALEPVAGKLLVLQAERHQNLTIWGVVPLLVCDVWEHAYYLKYANNRDEWVTNFMQIANWDFAAKRLAAAM
jgi:superoxide dismutase, Fe-Mn family